MISNVEINKDVKLSQHFTLGELCKTSVKTADGNIPSHVHIENLKRLTKWLEMLREEWNRRYAEVRCQKEDGRCSIEEPVIINSAYRSPQVNKAVGSSDESQEPFDELLIEQSAKSIWVHFAVRPEGNRRKIEFLKK